MQREQCHCKWEEGCVYVYIECRKDWVLGSKTLFRNVVNALPTRTYDAICKGDYGFNVHRVR